MIPVCRPALPKARALLPYIARADLSRHYTNHGELAIELGRRLAALFGLPSDGAVLASNGTVAITGSLLAVAGRARPDKPLCIVPAYTFVATAIAAANAGYEPYLADVGRGSWALDPDTLKRLPGIEKAGAVIAVGPCARAPDIPAWERFKAETGIPVVIDAAACFDTLDKVAVAQSGIPIAVSLHATKTLSTAEGGVVFCRDPEVTYRIVRSLNFGFLDVRESVGPSTNGKLSEYHAAVGLADLDNWTDKRAGFMQVAEHYLRAAGKHGLEDRIMADAAHANPYVLYVAQQAREAETVQRRLREAGADTRLWYGLGLHRQPAFANCPRRDLATTDDLAPRIVGIPCAADMAADDILHVVETIARAAG